MKQLTKEQAIAFAENKCYEGMTTRQIAEFQLNQDRLCMPFGVFHEALEKELGRPVYTHEFGLNYDGLVKEFYGEKEPPTLDEIISLIPEEKKNTGMEITNEDYVSYEIAQALKKAGYNIKEWNGYFISDKGDVFNKKGVKLKPFKTSFGYLKITPYKNGVCIGTKSVHRLVAELFIPNPDNHPMINHINGVKTDNRVDNLEWCSASHNVRHAFATGLNHSATARAVVFCETGQVFPSPQKCVESMGWGNLASAITCCCRRSDKSKTKRRKIKGFTVRYYQPTPLVEKLLKCGYNKYPTDYNEDTYFCYLAQAQKWLREEKRWHVQVRINGIRDMFSVEIWEMKANGYCKRLERTDGHVRLFDSYESALSAGIEAALKLLTDKTNEI